MEKAAAYGARAVFFESGRHGRTPVAQAFIFDSADGLDDAAFAALHKRLWSWGGVPLVYRTSPGCVQLFRCAHAPDFLGSDGVPTCNPVRTLEGWHRHRVSRHLVGRRANQKRDDLGRS